LFNLFNRNQDAHFSVAQVALYVLMVIYLVTPWTVIGLWRCFRKKSSTTRPTPASNLTAGAAKVLVQERHPSEDGARGHPSNLHKAAETSVIATLFIVPLGLFLLLSFRKQIGLHWLLAFIPFIFLYVAIKLENQDTEKYKRWNLWLGLPHLIVLLGLIYLPTSSFQAVGLQTDLVLHREGKEVVQNLRSDLSDETVIMTTSYSMSSLLSHSSQTYLPVFGSGSVHARFDDSITDFRKIDQKNIRIISSRAINIESIKPFFERVTMQERQINGARLWAADGEKFRFDAYQQIVLTDIAARFYKLPHWLPNYGCGFLQKYGFI
jgi:hypothetical protein